MSTTYEQDSALIDRIIVINAGLYGDNEIIRRAGIVDMLGGLANSIKSTIAGRVEREGVAGALTTYLVNGYIWKMNPLLRVVSWAADYFGYSPGKIFKWASDAAMKTINDNGEFSEEDAKRIANEASNQMNIEASMEPLHDLAKRGMLSSIMQGHFDNNEIKKEARPNRGAVGLFNIFRYFGKGRRSRSLLGGFFKWAIFTVLSGLAMIEGPRLVTHMFGGKYEDEVSEQSDTGSGGTGAGGPPMIGVPKFLTDTMGGGATQQQQSGLNFPKLPNNLKASGKGEKYFINGPQNQWWVKVPNGDIRSAMSQWAQAIYPELAGHDQEIRSSKSFDRTAYVLARNYNPQSMMGWLKVPASNLHTWRDIVDTFAGEAAKNIQQQQSKKV